MMTTKLYRSRKSSIVHAANCKRIGSNSIPWLWAEDKTRAEVKAAEVNGLKWCKFCKPLEVIDAA
jgi:hypothetical protein